MAETTVGMGEIARMVAEATIDELRFAGWRFIPPGYVMTPQSREEAIALRTLCEQYLKDHPVD